MKFLIYPLVFIASIATFAESQSHIVVTNIYDDLAPISEDVGLDEVSYRDFVPASCKYNNGWQEDALTCAWSCGRQTYKKYYYVDDTKICYCCKESSAN